MDFWANWCRPCLQVGSRLEEIAEESGKEVVIAKFNVDENTLIPSDYGIRSIPYLLMIKGGEIVDSLVGNKSKNDIQYFIAENLI